MNRSARIKWAVLGIIVMLLLGLTGAYFGGAWSAPTKSPETPTPPTQASTALSSPPLATQPTSLVSTPAEKSGLSITIQPVDPIVTPDKHLAINVTYRNTSTRPIRFGSGGTGMSSVLFHLRNQKNDTIYTAGSNQMMNGAPLANRPTGRPPKPTDPPRAGPIPTLQPGESRTVDIATYATVGFYAGNWDDYATYLAASRDLSRGHDGSPRLDGGYGFAVGATGIRFSPAQIPFPPGTYKLSISVEFPVGEQPGAPDDSAPLWKEPSIRSNEVEIHVLGVAVDFSGFPADAADMTPGTGWISGTVLDLEGKPAINLPLFAYLVMDLRNPPQAIPAGHADSNGRYTIKNLPPGRYMVIAGNWHVAGERIPSNDPAPEFGSLQPIEVKQDLESKVRDPIKLVRPRNVGGGA